MDNLRAYIPPMPAPHCPGCVAKEAESNRLREELAVEREKLRQIMEVVDRMAGGKK